MNHNQILTAEEMLNELSASLTSLHASHSFKSCDFYLSSASLTHLWTSDPLSAGDYSYSSESDSFRKRKFYHRKRFVTSHSDGDLETSNASENNSRTSGSLSSRYRRNDSNGIKLTTTSSSSFHPPIKRRKRFTKRSSVENRKSQYSTIPVSPTQPSLKLSPDTLHDLRTKFYKKYLREIKSEYLDKQANAPNHLMVANYLSESSESTKTMNRSSRSTDRWYGSIRRRIPLQRRVTSPSFHRRYKHRSSSNRSNSSRGSSQYHRYRQRSTSLESHTTGFSAHSNKISDRSFYNRGSVYRSRSREKHSPDRCYFKYSSFPRFCIGYRLPHNQENQYFSQSTDNDASIISSKESDLSISVRRVLSSWYSFVSTLWPLVIITNLISVIKNIGIESRKMGTSNVETTFTQTIPLPSESSSADFGDMAMHIQDILQIAHQPACGGKDPSTWKSIDTDIDLCDIASRCGMQF